MEYLTEEDFAVAKANGVPYGVAYNRYYSLGWSVKRATTEPVEDKHGWSKWRKKALKNGVNYATYRHRVKVGCTHKEAATIRRGELDSKRKHRFTKQELVEANERGIATGTVLARWRQGG